MTNYSLLIAVMLFGLLSTKASSAQGVSAGLVVTYGRNGLERVAYRGQVIDDAAHYAGDAFHIWHMKSSTLDGHAMRAGEYGWGETNEGRSWDATSKTWTYRFKWGDITSQYVQQGDRLDIRVVETNRSDSGIIFQGASIYPLALHLDPMPKGFATGTLQYADEKSGPGVTVAESGLLKIAAVVPDAAKPLYSGFQSGGNGAWSLMVSSTSPDALPASAEHFDRPVLPGQRDTYTLSVRFADATVSDAALAGDAYQRYAERFPALMHWTDRRVIGTAFLASSPQGEKSRPAGFPGNPRRYFSDATGVDVRDAAGLARFQQRVLAQAATIVANLKRLDAQGVVTWDIEGEEYPQDTSYVCAPDEIAEVSPEMQSVITDGASPFNNMPLADAYFKIIRDAGFRVGVCVRPQHFERSGNGDATQVLLENSKVSAELVRKMRFAQQRWGASIFYIDSTVQADGTTLPAFILETVAAAFPDCLLIPEESTLRMYRSMAPFQTFLFHGDTSTPAAARILYPQSFSVNLVNDVDEAKLLQHRAELIDSVRQGDILMVHADAWQANNSVVQGIYRAAARRDH